jgi:ketosteroid isomerase-like protein
MSIASANVLAAEDELEIRALVSRYHDANNQGDETALIDTWASDGQWHVGPRTLVGHEAIRELWKLIMAPYESRLIQLVAHSRVRGTPDGAVGHETFLEFARKIGEETDHVEIGSYEDRYARESGRWVFAERRFALVYRNRISAGEFLPFPSAGWS